MYAVRILVEDKGEVDEGMVGKLHMNMYGTQDVAANWAAKCRATLKEVGYEQGKSSPCIFHHKLANTGVMVHGDDFVGVENPVVRKALEEKYRLKVEMLSGDREDVQELY